MVRIPKYIKTDALLQLRDVTTLLKGLLNESLPEEVFNDLSLKIVNLEAINLTDIAAQKSNKPQINIGQTIGDFVTQFCLHAEPNTVWRLMKQLVQYAPIIETSTRPNGLKLAHNQTLIGQVLRSAALIGLCYVATQIEFELANVAIQTRADIAELIDFELMDLENENVKTLLIEVRDNSIDYISNIIKGLSSIADITTEVQTPSIILAYDIYGDANKAVDLVKINGLKNSLLCPTKIEAAI
ncbi:MAG: hypothetical protein HRU28_02540 [Rhizobiales bacterium]|nr:hypothetical protein [Hyphomicrobiales bacterium]